MRNLIITFTFLCVSLITLTLFIGVTKTNPKPILKTPKPHLFGNEQIPIEEISLTVFYFVPKDLVEKEQANWKEITEQHLKKILDFHALQFEGTSKITYDFFPEIIIGQKMANEYGNISEHENSDALTQIKDEITQRATSSKGNLNTAFKNNPIGVRRVYLIVFEGDGGAGNDDFCLISRSYLTDNDYLENGTTFLAHEFYHTLGLVDNYQTSTYVYKDGEQIPVSLITKKDIMGQVNVPLSHTYIDTGTLKKMGL